MNPTQNQGNYGPEHSDGETGIAAQLAGLLTNGHRFRTWIAQAVNAAAHPVISAPAETEPVGYDVTDAGRAALMQPAAQPAQRVLCGGPGVSCRKCGTDMSCVYVWDEPVCPDCGNVVPADNPHGYLVTGADTAPSTCPVDLVTETDDETTARVLRLAAAYLKRHGWIQGAYYDATSGSFAPPACLVGAIGMVCYGGPVDAPAQHFDDPGFLDFEAAVLHLDRYLLAEDGSESYEFNDARGRRVEDVTRVLRDAATRPAHELIDALRVIDQHNADIVALAEMLVPSGVARCPYCGSSRRAVRVAIDEGDGPAFCDHDWHDGGSEGGDVR
ncbi:hypothetical protein [Actinoplanes sp. NPDC026619]|uniref:DUF6197 family protein n=1 Tax=Actinoplanes sp. NPDC026619 TaxID=3155798 RepID=UPI00340B952C